MLIAVVPRICARFPHVRWLVAGDGPKRVPMEEMIEAHQLHEQVEMCGSVAAALVPQHLQRCQVFLSCSLTEAFNISMIEAASCGLVVVSTRVGGVPEVLPEQMALLCEPTPDGVETALVQAIGRVGRVDALAQHRFIAATYNWRDVTTRVEAAYARALASRARRPCSADAHLRTVWSSRTPGSWTSFLAACFFSFWLILDLFVLALLVRWQPVSSMDPAVDFPFPVELRRDRIDHEAQ